MGGDTALAMAMKAALAVLSVLLILAAFTAAENPVESLDSGEIAEIDDGNFVDLFDDDDDQGAADKDDDHLGASDMKTALNTWDVLYGGQDHPSKLGASSEPAAEQTVETEAEPNPKIEAKQEEEKKIREKLMKAKSVDETAQLEEKLGRVKDQVSELKA